MTTQGAGTLDGHTVLAALRRVERSFDKHRAEMNSLNVFPVPDADTGSNLLATVTSARVAAEGVKTKASAAAVLAAAASAAARDARGNSGILAAQGLSTVRRVVGAIGAVRDLRASDVATCLAESAGGARDCLAAPREGTMLTVFDAAATAAVAAASMVEESAEGAPDSVRRVVRAAATAAAAALVRTTSQLSELATAGVVDAGGYGLLLVLDALVGDDTDERDLALRSTPRSSGGQTVSAPTTPDATHYEVVFLLDPNCGDAGVPEEMAARVRGDLAAVGDSVAVIAEGSGVTAHVHTNDIPGVLRVGQQLGAVSDIRVEILAGIPEEVLAGIPEENEDTAAAVPSTPGPTPRTVVALTRTTAMGEIFATAGAHPVSVAALPDPADTDAGPPSLRRIATDVLAIAPGEIVLLPNGALTRPDVLALVGYLQEAGSVVLVIPTSSPVQGMAALAVHDGTRPLPVDAFDMTEAVAGTRRAAVSVARRPALTFGGETHPGDLLGSIGNDVLLVGSDAATVARDLLDLLLAAGGDLVTLLPGPGWTAEESTAVTDHVAAHHPGVDVVLYPEGASTDCLTVGVE